MPNRSPLPNWTGKDVYLIGGGRSLRGFDWTQLKRLCTIGCNQAFQLGASICKICIFGDYRFWETYQQDLESSFDGWVATNYLTAPQPDWLHFIKRQNEGLGDTELAWNGNTGAAAINLALLLGASRVLLLGYDCQMDAPQAVKPSSSHWHDNRIEVPTPAHYERFAASFFNVAQALPLVFPGRQVVNIHDGASRLACFPVKTFEEIGLGGPACV